MKNSPNTLYFYFTIEIYECIFYYSDKNCNFYQLDLGYSIPVAALPLKDKAINYIDGIFSLIPDLENIVLISNSKKYNMKIEENIKNILKNKYNNKKINVLSLEV